MCGAYGKIYERSRAAASASSLFSGWCLWVDRENLEEKKDETLIGIHRSISWKRSNLKCFERNREGNGGRI